MLSGVLEPPPLFDDAVPRVLEAVGAAPNDASWWTWLAVERASRAPVGVLGFGGTPDFNGAVSIGYATYAAFRGRGLASEGVDALIAWAFEDPRVRIVRATIPPANAPSRRLAERVGMALIGTDVDPDVGEVLVYERRRGTPVEPIGVRRCVEELEAASVQAARLVRPLTADQLAWIPAPGAWSIGRCLDHLALAGDLWAESCRRASERARTRGRFGAPPFRLGFVGGTFARLMEPPARTRFRAPRRMRPAAPRDPAGALERFDGAQRRLVAAVRGAEGLDLSRIIVRAPASPFLWINLAAAFAAATAHERRHLWQAGRVATHPAFPGP